MKNSNKTTNLYEKQDLGPSRTWAEIDLKNLSFNFSQIKKKLDCRCKIMSIVKADAYGHGDKIVAKHLVNQVDFFGVATIAEAVSLRESGIDKPILVLGYTPVDFADTLSKYNIYQTILNFEYAKKLSDAALKKNQKINAHIKIDSGMNRIGFVPNKENFGKLIETYKLSGLEISGIFTHFCVADEKDSENTQFTIKQFKIFEQTCKKLENAGINLGIRHCCNSAATLKFPQMHLDMVRIGIGLYGPYIDNCEDFLEENLKPVLSLKSKVTMVKKINPGESIGYGRRFVAKKPMTIATICAGYADGLNRLLSCSGTVFLHQKPAKIIGSICMDQSMLDVSNIPDVAPDDEVILWGASEYNLNHNLNYIAKKINTIPYELLCNINKRVPRIYKN